MCGHFQEKLAFYGRRPAAKCAEAATLFVQYSIPDAAVVELTGGRKGGGVPRSAGPAADRRRSHAADFPRECRRRRFPPASETRQVGHSPLIIIIK